jgi:hypothetical protein
LYICNINHEKKRIMNTQLIKSVSIKYGLIAGGVGFVLALFPVLLLRTNLYEIFSYLSSSLNWIILFLVIILAHVEFVKKIDGRMAFKDAFSIGLFIILFHFVFGFAANQISIKIYNSMFELSNDSLSITTTGLFYSILYSMRILLIKVAVLFMLLYIESSWLIYKKAGKQGWAAFVPIYNTIILLEIVNKPIIWFFYMMIPVVNIIYVIKLNVELAKKFGKDESFAVGLLLIPFVFYPILGFGEEKYLQAE